ncbi:adhesion regulating molecule [Sistotremastrum niveocremeum HHB9708]|uniref:Adhesion regulating molecule n=1 Tax=Sistotremastrum niveocremeum HHB9708 TaxID=1314777 RepID=A0A164UVP4_9AGAM|nr:adhesion regulating molecule [Sistotremastrum niveocremeum HHB9708]
MATQTLLSFKAGRSFRREGSSFVDASPVKGSLELLRGDDELLHLLWKNRATGQVEDDLIIFPMEAQFLKVPHTAGRTYVLKFSSSNQRHFFWMQDLSDSRDAEYATHVNGYLADPEYDPSTAAGPASSSQQAGPSAPPAPSTAPAGVTEDQLAELRALVSQVSQEQTLSQPGQSYSSARICFYTKRVSEDLSLSDVLTPSNLRPLFSNPRLLTAVFPHLPPDLPVPPSAESIQRIIESPQFQAGVRSLDQALATGLLSGLVKSLGLPEEAGLGVGPFLTAISRQAEHDHHDESGQDSMQTD